MVMLRVTAEWTGFTGGPGYSNFFFSGPGGATAPADHAASVRAFFGSMASILPTSLRINVLPEVALVDEASGLVQDFVDAGVLTPVSGAATGPFSGPTGACITWITDGVRNGRRVRGRTFLVPLSNAAYEADGTLAAAALTSVRTAAAALHGTGESPLVIWARPSSPGAADGHSYMVRSARVQDKAAVLRSRRD